MQSWPDGLHKKLTVLYHTYVYIYIGYTYIHIYIYMQVDCDNNIVCTEEEKKERVKIA